MFESISCIQHLSDFRSSLQHLLHGAGMAHQQPAVAQQLPLCQGCRPKDAHAQVRCSLQDAAIAWLTVWSRQVGPAVACASPGFRHAQVHWQLNEPVHTH